jgi:hypothetical protein
VVGEFALTSHHVVGGAVKDEDCAVCHYEAVDDNYHKDNIIHLRNPDDANLAAVIDINSTDGTFTRNRATDVLESWVTDVQDNFCMRCHDVDGAIATAIDSNTPLRPFSFNSQDVPDIFSSFDPNNDFYHPVRGAGNNTYCNSTTMELPWNQSADEHNVISCFDCHAVNGHGGNNNQNLRSQITGTTDASGILTFCGSCHKDTSYNSGNTGSFFGDHSRGQHNANIYACRGCHAGQVDADGTATSDNGGRYPQIMIHGGSFTWDANSQTSGVSTDYFLFGGYLGGLDPDPLVRDCFGGSCSHTTGAKNWP